MTGWVTVIAVYVLAVLLLASLGLVIGLGVWAFAQAFDRGREMWDERRRS